MSLPSRSLSNSNNSTFEARLCKLSFQLVVAVNSDVQVGTSLRSHDSRQWQKVVGPLDEAGRVSAEHFVGSSNAAAAQGIFPRLRTAMRGIKLKGER